MNSIEKIEDTEYMILAILIIFFNQIFFQIFSEQSEAKGRVESWKLG